MPAYLMEYTRKPEYALGPHVAALGMVFAREGHVMGDDFASGVSWRGTDRGTASRPSGYDVVYVAFDARGNPVGKPQPVLTGFLTGEGTTRGRPTWVEWAGDGRLAGVGRYGGDHLAGAFALGLAGRGDCTADQRTPAAPARAARSARGVRGGLPAPAGRAAELKGNTSAPRQFGGELQARCGLDRLPRLDGEGHGLLRVEAKPGAARYSLQGSRDRWPCPPGGTPASARNDPPAPAHRHARHVRAARSWYLRAW